MMQSLGSMHHGMQAQRPMVPGLQLQQAQQQQRQQAQQQAASTNGALLQAVNGMWQDLQAVRLQMDAMRRDMTQMRGDIVRLTRQLTEHDGYVRRQVALSGMDKRNAAGRVDGGLGAPTTGGAAVWATAPHNSPQRPGVTGPVGPPSQSLLQPLGSTASVPTLGGGQLAPPTSTSIRPLAMAAPLQSQAPIGMPGTMPGAMQGGMPTGPLGGMGALGQQQPSIEAGPGAGPGLVDMGMGMGMGASAGVSRPQTVDNLGPSVSQRGSVAHTSRSAATSVLSVRDLKDPSNRGSREDILRAVFDKVDTAGVGKVSFGDLCDYVATTARSSGSLPIIGGGGDGEDDWMAIQRLQCCVFLSRKGGGLLESFRQFGFDEHSAITWDDFAKFAHRVYEGQGPSQTSSRASSPVKRKNLSRPASKRSMRRDIDEDDEGSDGEDGGRRRDRGRGSGEDDDDGSVGRTSRSRRRPDESPPRRSVSRGRSNGTRARSDDDDDDARSHSSRRRRAGTAGSKSRRSTSRARSLRHEDDSDNSDEEPFTAPYRRRRAGSRRSASRQRARPRRSTSRGGRRLRKKRGRGGGYNTESAMTDASGPAGLTGYNSTGGRRNARRHSDSDDDVQIVRRKRKGKRRGKGKPSVQKPPKNLPKGWSAAWDGQYNRYYFYNADNVVTWDRPQA